MRCPFIILVSCRFDCLILRMSTVFHCTDPAPPPCGLQSVLVCPCLEKHAPMFCLLFFFPKSIFKVVVTASPPEKKTNVPSY